MSKLILLKLTSPLEFEIHKGEINRTKNLIFTTTDKELAEDIVARYNIFVLPENNPQENLVEQAKQYAIGCHQMVCHLYDNQLYTVHLEMVYEYGEKFAYLLPKEDVEIVLAACWAHDLIEDTRRTYNDVKYALNEKVADIVYALSNEKGKTRAERANQKYYDGIVVDLKYAFTKICDRLANIKYSKQKGSGMFNAYKKEHQSFTNHLSCFKPVLGPMFEEMDMLFI